MKAYMITFKDKTVSLTTDKNIEECLLPIVKKYYRKVDSIKKLNKCTFRVYGLTKDIIIRAREINGHYSI